MADKVRELAEELENVSHYADVFERRIRRKLKPLLTKAHAFERAFSYFHNSNNSGYDELVEAALNFRSEFQCWATQRGGNANGE